MNALRQWLARVSQQWLENFRRQYGLQIHPQQVVKAPAKQLLHVGCGPADISNIPVAGFQSEAWVEVRLDINSEVHPDIVGTMTDMRGVPDAHVDAIYSSHNIEHLCAHEVPIALKEFLRVLKPDGFLTLTCPDLLSVCALVAQGKLLETAYHSPAGPIAPVDILYGHRNAIRAGNHYMAHRYGFTLETLTAHLRDAGFSSVIGYQRAESLDLWVLASKVQHSQEELKAAARRYLPPISTESV